MIFACPLLSKLEMGTSFYCLDIPVFFLLHSFMQPYLYLGRAVDTDALPDLINFLNQFLCNIKG